MTCMYHNDIVLCWNGVNSKEKCFVITDKYNITAEELFQYRKKGQIKMKLQNKRKGLAHTLV